MGVETVIAKNAIPPNAKLQRLVEAPKPSLFVSSGPGPSYEFPYSGPSGALIVNRLLKGGSGVALIRR